MTEPDQYFLGYRAAEQERLQRHAEQLEHEARWLFDQIPLSVGAHAVEIGCGPRGCLDLLAERVGPPEPSSASGGVRRRSPSLENSLPTGTSLTSKSSTVMPDLLVCQEPYSIS